MMEPIELLAVVGDGGHARCLAAAPQARNIAQFIAKELESGLSRSRCHDKLQLVALAKPTAFKAAADLPSLLHPRQDKKSGGGLGLCRFFEPKHSYERLKK